MNIKQEFIQRSSHAYYFLLALSVAIVVRLVQVQYFAQYRGKFWNERIEGFQIRQDTLRAMRGNIYAHDGSLLATSLPKYEVGIDPRVAKDAYFKDKVDSLGRMLAGLFQDRTGREYADMIRDARKEKRKYLLLNRRRITFEERQAMMTWPFFRRTLKIPPRGGAFRTYYERYHPFDQMALRTVGDLDPGTGRGQMGLEASFQPQLAGKDAVGLVEVISGGVRKPVEDGPNMKPEPGLDLHTTIDVNFQDMAESALRNALDKYQADRGCVIVMEVKTGEIRAMANLARGEDAAPAPVTEPDSKTAVITPGRYVEKLNYALVERTDPGSTFKLASIMALMEAGAFNPRQLVNTGKGHLRYRGISIEDSHRGGWDVISAEEVFEKSSNIGTHLLMQQHFYQRPEQYCQYLRQFRLNQPTGIHMKGEAPPKLPNPQSPTWSKSSITFMSYGYEMQLTPLQMLTFYNAVANNGYWVRPRIVREIRMADDVVERAEPYVSEEPIAKPSTIKMARRLMEGVVERGTAKGIWTPYYKIAGKTGTAQKLINGQYQVGRYYTSFIGYFPADAPKYSMITVVDNPHGNNIDLLYGGSVAAPVFREVADRIFAYDARMHPALKQKSGATAPADRLPRPRLPQTAPGRVPDVRGLPLRDALYVLENRGLRVSVQPPGNVAEEKPDKKSGKKEKKENVAMTVKPGPTWVVEQSLVPDTLLPPPGRRRITLVLGTLPPKTSKPQSATLVTTKQPATNPRDVAKHPSTSKITVASLR